MSLALQGMSLYAFISLQDTSPSGMAPLCSLHADELETLRYLLYPRVLRFFTRSWWVFLPLWTLLAQCSSPSPAFRFYSLDLLSYVPGWYLHLVYRPWTACRVVKRSVSYSTFCISSPPSQHPADFHHFRWTRSFSWSWEGFSLIY